MENVGPTDGRLLSTIPSVIFPFLHIHDVDILFAEQLLFPAFQWRTHQVPMLLCISYVFYIILLARQYVLMFVFISIIHRRTYSATCYPFISSVI